MPQNEVVVIEAKGIRPAPCGALRVQNAAHPRRAPAMSDTTPSLQPPAILLGPWTAEALARPRVVGMLDARLQAVPTDAAWDLRGVERLDHVGAQLLWEWWGRQWPPQVALWPEQRAVFDRVSRWTTPASPPTTAPRGVLFLALGAWLLNVAHHLHRFVVLVGELALNLLALARSPGRGPWRDLSGHLFVMGMTALPITALVGFLIGVVLAYLTAQQLRPFGADAYIVNILGLALVRELGPLLAAVLIAGRSGSAITAQIGAMRVTEELDAMRVLGISPGWRLVMPRALALALALPLLATWTTLCALAGGMLAADLSLGISPSYVFQALPAAVPAANLWLSLAKSVVFGLLVALVGCHCGLGVLPDTRSLGRSTTTSVVVTITGVILVDALFAILFQEVGL